MFGWIQSAMKRGESGLPEDLTERIKAADIFQRTGDSETGLRIYVGLRGGFIFTREEAEKRIRKGWPELTNNQVRRAVDFLQARVLNAIAFQRGETRRKSWIHDY